MLSAFFGDAKKWGFVALIFFLIALVLFSGCMPIFPFVGKNTLNFGGQHSEGTPNANAEGYEKKTSGVLRNVPRAGLAALCGMLLCLYVSKQIKCKLGTKASNAEKSFIGNALSETVAAIEQYKKDGSESIGVVFDKFQTPETQLRIKKMKVEKESGNEIQSNSKKRT